MLTTSIVFKFEHPIPPSLWALPLLPARIRSSTWRTFPPHMSGLKKKPSSSSSSSSLLPLRPPSSSSSSYKSLYVNPLTDPSLDKENAVPVVDTHCYSRCAASPAAVKTPSFCKAGKVQPAGAKAAPPRVLAERQQNGQAPDLKTSSLQLCMRIGEPERPLGSLGPWDPFPSSSDVWDFSDSEAAPASSWSTLPNRALLCRPLPVDVGRCTCIIAKESAQGLDGVSVYSLYTNEGHGRQDRKLAMARHKRRNGRSEFIVAQNVSGIFCGSDDSFLGTITANLMGSKYHMWDQGSLLCSMEKQSKRLLGVAEFVPTITTLTGNFRSMRAWVPKHHSMQLKSTSQIQHVNGLPSDYQEKASKSHQLVSKVPHYNSISKQYELDFRERGGRPGSRIQPSVKNFQLTLEEKGRQSILQLGRIGKLKYLMEYRYPLTGYQAFCICLASIDSKLCCSV